MEKGLLLPKGRLPPKNHEPPRTHVGANSWHQKRFTDSQVPVISRPNEADMTGLLGEVNLCPPRVASSFVSVHCLMKIELWSIAACALGSQLSSTMALFLHLVTLQLLVIGYFHASRCINRERKGICSDEWLPCLVLPLKIIALQGPNSPPHLTFRLSVFPITYFRKRIMWLGVHINHSST